MVNELVWTLKSSSLWKQAEASVKGRALCWFRKMPAVAGSSLQGSR